MKGLRQRSRGILLGFLRRDLGRKKLKGSFDMMSAVIVLNDYLEREKIDD